MEKKFTWGVGPEPEITTEYAGTTLGDYYNDPDVMVDTEIKSAKKFKEIFGCGTGEVESITTNVLFYSCACTLGSELVILEDASPQIQEGLILQDLKDIAKLKVVDDVANTPFVDDMVKRHEHMLKRSAVTGVTPVFKLYAQSPMGTAILLRGTDIFYDMVTEPEAIKDLLEIVTQTAVNLIKFETEFNGKTREGFGMDDDYGGLVSPDLYEKFNLPYMRRLYEAGGTEQRGLHSETLVRGHMKHLRSLGITDYDAWPYNGFTVEDVVAEHPDIFFTWNIQTTRDLFTDTPEMIKTKFRHAIDAGAPGMSLCLCARAIPRENIQAFVDIAKELENEN